MAVRRFEQEFQRRLGHAAKVVVMAVGDELDFHDCLGTLAGRRISELGLPRVEVLLTSQMPENYTSVVRRLAPSHVVLIDAAEMGRQPGEISFIDPAKVKATRVSTHAMPLSMVMTYLEKELGVKVSLVGIQPATKQDKESGIQPIGVRKGLERIANAFRDALQG